MAASVAADCMAAASMGAAAITKLQAQAAHLRWRLKQRDEELRAGGSESDWCKQHAT